MMTISNEQIEEMMTKYQCYVAKIINRKYSHADYETRKELRQAGMIGLWKGIKAYYRRDPKRFDEKEFVDTICAYMRYEMADLFHERHIIRMQRKALAQLCKSKENFRCSSGSSRRSIHQARFCRRVFDMSGM